MPFRTEFLESASREFEIQNIKTDFEAARSFIMKTLKECAKVEQQIKLDNIDIYIHGSYANKTNIYFPSSLEIIVELKSTLECDPKNLTPENYRLYNNYYVDIPLQFGPQAFRELFFVELTKIVGNKAQMKDKSIILSDIEKIKHTIEITPCFSFNFTTNGETHQGVLLYDKTVNANIISFPRLHAQNGQTKDAATKGNFKRMVRLFKTLSAMNSHEFDFIKPGAATGYFIECLLFNVPNKLFIGGELPEIFKKVINYLMNCEFDEFICQNMIWPLFATANEFWQKDRAEQFLEAIVQLYSIFPHSRTFLA